MVKPPARPVFRKLAIGVAIVCFLLAVVITLAVVFTLIQREDMWFPVVSCLFVGVVMMSIGITGYWPPRRKR